MLATHRYEERQSKTAERNRLAHGTTSHVDRRLTSYGANNIGTSGPCQVNCWRTWSRPGKMPIYPIEEVWLRSSVQARLKSRVYRNRPVLLSPTKSSSTNRGSDTGIIRRRKHKSRAFAFFRGRVSKPLK